MATKKMPVYCSRCGDLASVEITARGDNDVMRSATACPNHKATVKRWAARVGTPTITTIDQPLAGQLSLFPLPEVKP